MRQFSSSSRQRPRRSSSLPPADAFSAFTAAGNGWSPSSSPYFRRQPWPCCARIFDEHFAACTGTRRREPHRVGTELHFSFGREKLSRVRGVRHGGHTLLLPAVLAILTPVRLAQIALMRTIFARGCFGERGSPWRWPRRNWLASESF